MLLKLLPLFLMKIRSICLKQFHCSPPIEVTQNIGFECINLADHVIYFWCCSNVKEKGKIYVDVLLLWTISLILFRAHMYRLLICNLFRRLNFDARLFKYFDASVQCFLECLWAYSKWTNLFYGQMNMLYFIYAGIRMPKYASISC